MSEHNSEHNWVWKDQGVRFVGENPYCVDYWECTICGKEITSAGGHAPSKKGCKNKIKNLGPPDFICRR
jgi:hypothetical protein